MAKWTSPLFTDIRNKIGDSVVFSNWKGRGYFRAYAKPANPNTNKQAAVRDVMKNIVARFKAVVDDADKKGAWNTVALPFLISGYNAFTKFGQGTSIAAATGTGSKEIDITYTLGFGAAKAKVYGLEGSNYEDVTPAEGLSAGVDQEATLTMGQGSTEYTIFIAHADALKSGDSHPQGYAAMTCWKADKTNGVAVAATCDSAAA